MAIFSRELRRRSLVRIASAALGTAWLLVLAAYVYAATTSQASTPSIVAAAAAFVIAGTGILYAWREPGR